MTIHEETAERLRLFLILRKKLSIANIGSFEWVRVPATYHEATGSFSKPSDFLQFSDSASSHSNGLIDFLSSGATISETDAHQRLKDWCEFVTECLQSGEEFEWEGIGKLVMHNNQIILKKSIQQLEDSNNDLPTKSVEQFTNDYDEEEVQQESTLYWNVWMTLLALASVIVIILYMYSEGRFGVGRFGILYPAKPSLQYQLKSAL